jgi:DKNYY family
MRFRFGALIVRLYFNCSSGYSLQVRHKATLLTLHPLERAGGSPHRAFHFYPAAFEVMDAYQQYCLRLCIANSTDDVDATQKNLFLILMPNSKILLVSLISFLFGCKSPNKSELFKTQDGVAYYRNETIPESDAKSFEALDEHYAKDKNHVWYCDTYRSGQDYFSTKRNRIAAIEKADPATFKILKNSYARDKANMFFEGTFFPVKDINTFEILDYSFAKDRVSGYYMQVEIPGSDGGTFAGIDNHYSKDKGHIYYSDVEPGGAVRSAAVQDADLSTFAILDNPTDSIDAKDKDALYLKGRKVKK